jgi:hypothetical protein
MWFTVLFFYGYRQFGKSWILPVFVGSIENGFSVNEAVV